MFDIKFKLNSEFVEIFQMNYKKIEEKQKQCCYYIFRYTHKHTDVSIIMKCSE